MHPDFHAFADELVLIKAAQYGYEPEEELEEEAPPPGRNKRLLRNALLGGAAFGVGTGTGHLLGQTVLPKVWPGLSPSKRLLVANLGGALAAGGGLALSESLKESRRLADGRG